MMSLVTSWLSCNVIAFVMTLNGSGVFLSISCIVPHILQSSGDSLSCYVISH